MIKQEVFPLYLNGKTEIQTPAGIKTMWSVDLGTNKIETSQDAYSYAFDISDCQLILKRISDMSEEDCVKFVTEACGYENAKEIKSIPADGGGWAEIRVILEDNTNIIIEMGVYDLKIFFWLIQHGYALNDDWFTNGIAVEASQIAEKEEK